MDFYRDRQGGGPTRGPFLFPCPPAASSSSSSSDFSAQEHRFVSPYDVVIGTQGLRLPPPPPPPLYTPESNSPSIIATEYPFLIGTDCAEQGRANQSSAANVILNINSTHHADHPHNAGARLRFPSRSLPPPLLSSGSIFRPFPTSPRKYVANASYANSLVLPYPRQSLAASLMERSFSAPASLASRTVLPPFSTIPGAASGTNVPARRVFSGSEVPLPNLTMNMTSILANRKVREEAQQQQVQASRDQISLQRKQIEIHLAQQSAPRHESNTHPYNDTVNTAVADGLASLCDSATVPYYAGRQQAPAFTHVIANRACVLQSDASDHRPDESRKLFPRRLHPKGRNASKPPPCGPDEPAHMRPRTQPEKFPGDLYTPAIVRAGKSSGQSESAGIGSKEAWCGLCEPHQTSTVGSGSSLVGGWLNLRNSSYRYHMIRAHGISPKTYRPFREPLKVRKRHAGVDGKVGDGSELMGLCHQCKCWVVFGTHEPTNFWVHASKCHCELIADTPDGTEFAHMHGFDCTSVTPPRASRSSFLSAAKRKPLAPIDAAVRSMHNKRPRHCSDDDGHINWPNKSAGKDVIDEAGQVRTAAEREPGWSISRSGRIIRLRDSQWSLDA